jgi:regulator of sigma E protease
MLTSIIAAVVILGVLVLVHESGHFIMAKRSGVRVVRFSIGLPPKLFSFRRGETEYQIGATPFGGYVRMLGDEIGDEHGSADVLGYLEEVGNDLLAAAERVCLPEHAQASKARPSTPAVDAAELSAVRNGESATNPHPQRLLALAKRICDSPRPAAILGREMSADETLLIDEICRSTSVSEALKALANRRPPALIRRIQERAFPSQSLGKRLLIVLAGPLANLLFAPILLTIVFVYGVPRLLPVLGQIRPNMPAAVGGLKEGDRVTSINGAPIKSWDDLSNTIKASGGDRLRIDYQRGSDGGAVRSVMVKPVQDGKSGLADAAGSWIIGVSPRGDYVVSRVNPIAAMGNAVVETGKMSVMLVAGIYKIIDGSTPVRQALGGPIMIAQLAGREAHEGFASVALFTVMLSIELGIINLLPVPMLDGGHILFFLIEGVRGKPLQVRHREIAQQVGLFLLVVLMAFVIFNDISRIVQG